MDSCLQIIGIIAYVLIVVLGKAFAHEGGHALALKCIDRWFVHKVSGYTPQKVSIRVEIGLGRVDSPLYGILVKRGEVCFIKLVALAGISGEMLYCVAVIFVTNALYGNLPLVLFIGGTLIAMSITMLCSTRGQSQSDIEVIFHPEGFKGESGVDSFSRKRRREGLLVTLVQVFLLLFCFFCFSFFQAR